MISVVHESPASRFARRQAERKAEKAAAQLAISRKVVEERRRPKIPTPPPVRRPRSVHGVEYALVTADLVQRHGMTEAARQLDESRQMVLQRLRRHGLTACHPVLHAKDYATRHGLATWERVP